MSDLPKLSELTPEQKRALIAGACGWEDFKTADKIGRTITKTIVATNDVERARARRRAARGLPEWPYVEVPDYLGSLDAAITLCDVLAKDGWDLVLSSRMGAGPFNVTFAKEPRQTVTACADNLARAIGDCFLLATGKATA